jgi:[ribosomal protein S5]-alanine N-acetyltransferase
VAEAIVALPTLETRRLILRPVELADAPAIQELFPHWEIVRYLSTAVPWPYPPDGAYKFLRDVALPQIERGEAWHWSLRRKAAPELLIGMISVMKHEQINRGFWIATKWQKQGLMTEASDAATALLV